MPAKDERLLLERIRYIHTAHQAVIGARRMHKELGFEGETANRNRIAQLTTRHRLCGTPISMSRRSRPSGSLSLDLRNLRGRKFVWP